MTDSTGQHPACRCWRRSLELYAEGAVIDSDLANSVRRHIAQCPSCATFLREYDDLTRHLLAGDGDVHDAPLFVHLENERRVSRIMEAVADESPRRSPANSTSSRTFNLWEEAAVALASQDASSSNPLTNKPATGHMKPRDTAVWRWAAAALFTVGLCGWLSNATHDAELSKQTAPANAPPVVVPSRSLAANPGRGPSPTGLWGWVREPARSDRNAILFAVPPAARHTSSHAEVDAVSRDRMTWLLEVLVEELIEPGRSDSRADYARGSSYFLVRADGDVFLGDVFSGDDPIGAGVLRTERAPGVYRVQPRYVAQGAVARVEPRLAPRARADRYRLYVHDRRPLDRLGVLSADAGLSLDARLGLEPSLPVGLVGAARDEATALPVGRGAVRYPAADRDGPWSSLWR